MPFIPHSEADVAAMLKTIEDLLGVPFMNQGQLPGATDLRTLVGM